MSVEISNVALPPLPRVYAVALAIAIARIAKKKLVTNQGNRVGSGLGRIRTCDQSVVGLNPPLIQIIGSLSPTNQQIITTLIKQLAAQEGITLPDYQSTYLSTPLDGVPLWRADMIARSFAWRTIDGYVNDAKAYLAKDPIPTQLSIRGYLANRLCQVSRSRVSSEVKALKSLFSFLYEQGLWPSNTTNNIKPIRIPERERECPTEEQVKSLLISKYYRKTDAPRFKMLIALLIDTGLRVSEAASILKQGIYLDRLEIRVIGKGNKERFVPLSPIVCAMLRSYLDKYANRESAYLFPGNNKTGYWDIRSIERTLRRLSGVTPHQLRHFYATNALKNGSKIEIVARVLGHSNVGITAKVYRHIQMEEVHEEHRRYGLFATLPITLPMTTLA